MTSLAEELRADQRRRAPHCKACVFIASQLNQEEWRAALLDSSFSIMSITRAAEKRGFKLGQGTITRHRKAGHA